MKKEDKSNAQKVIFGECEHGHKFAKVVSAVKGPKKDRRKIKIDPKIYKNLEAQGFEYIGKGYFQMAGNEEIKIKKNPKLFIPKKNKLPGPGSRTRP